MKQIMVTTDYHADGRRITLKLEATDITFGMASSLVRAIHTALDRTQETGNTTGTQPQLPSARVVKHSLVQCPNCGLILGQMPTEVDTSGQTDESTPSF